MSRRYLLIGLVGLLGACAANVGEKPVLDDPAFVEGDLPADGFTRRLQIRAELDLAASIDGAYAEGRNYAGYLFSATRGSQLAIDVAGHGSDPVVSLYGPARSTSWARRTPIATNDDSGGTLDSHLSRRIASDGVYLVIVREYSGDAGNFTLSLSCTGDHCDRPLCGDEAHTCPAQSTCRYLRCALPCHSYCEPVLPDVCDASECGPALGLPNRLCEDGTSSGPTGRCLRHDDGTCGWEVLSCPAPTRCGGLHGVVCAEGMFCDFPTETMCGSGDQMGNCETIPTLCTREFHQVCGCNGNTYSNACMAKAAATAVLHDGPC